MNVGAFITEAARQHPDRPAVTFAGRTTTFRELDARVNALAAGWEDLGVDTGDRVVVWMHNRPEFLETMLACWKRGIVVVPVNARLTPADVAFHAEDCEAKALVHGPDFAGVAGEVPVKHRVGVGDGAEIPYEEVLQPGSADQVVDVDDDAPAWLFYTSGTTGRPKGATLTHGNLTFVVVGWCADFHQLQPEDVVLHCAPLSHGAGFHALACVARGTHAVVHEHFDTEAVLEAIEAHRITTTWLVPTQIRMLLDDERLGASDLSSLTHIVYGGSPMHLEDIKEAVRRIGPVFCQLYGQGEAPMTITYLRREEHDPARPDEEVLTSAGVVRTGMEVRIVDPEDDTTRAPGETGEIVVRGPAVMAGYWDRPEATAETLRDGWLHTGDLGRLDERGNLYVLDRLKDLIISGGTNVYAREVEDVLLQYESVHEAAVFGVPDRRWGEAVTAAVVPDGDVTPEGLEEFCRSRMADFKRPKTIHVLDALPKNTYGKVLKRDLRETFSP